MYVCMYVESFNYEGFIVKNTILMHQMTIPKLSNVTYYPILSTIHMRHPWLKPSFLKELLFQIPINSYSLCSPRLEIDIAVLKCQSTFFGLQFVHCFNKLARFTLPFLIQA